jgi:hypothetical protein
MENYEPTTNCNQKKRRKWRWIGHTLRKPTGSIEKSVLDWNPQGIRRRGYPKRHGKGRLRMKPWKRGRHGARLNDWLLTGPGGGVNLRVTGRYKQRIQRGRYRQSNIARDRGK